MIKYVSNHRTNLDFTIDKYRKLCDALLRSGYSVSTVTSYLGNPKQAQNVLIMRHDVDRKPHRALLMAQVEHEFSIKSTYYFRFNKKVFYPQLIREIAKMGHEIGYHYEVLDKAKGDHGRAIEIFKNELDEFRKITQIKTICMHGNPLTEWDNRDIWDKHDFNDFGLIGEAYLSFSDITYLSDTGRTWRNKYKVKDWLPSTDYARIEKAGGPAISGTDKLIELIKSVEIRRIYLLVHPERWSNSITEWTFEYLRDKIINFMKLGLQMRKHTKLLRRVH
jgi:RNA binding exosome subunit